MISKITQFIQTGIWEIQLRDLPPAKALPVRYLRVVVLAVRGFYEDKCTLRASALTYYSLLSIVPLAALVFGIAKGFGLEEYIENQIMQLAQRGDWGTDVAGRIITFSRSLLKNTQGGVIAGIGVVFLLWTVISILGNIEESLNAIWEVRTSRTLVRKFTDYLAMTVSAPILFIISSSVTLLVASKVETIVHKLTFLGILGSAISSLMRFLPYVSIWVLLMLHYIVMPNTKVPLRSGILAGIVTGTIYQVIQWTYIKFQIGVAHYGAVYGSFAAVPLFLVWLQLSWMMVLFGAEISFADGNFETFGFHPDYSKMSISSKKFLALRIYHLLIKRFSRGEKAPSVSGISEALKIPARLVRQLLRELTSVGLVSEAAKDENREVTYQPGRSTENMTMKHVLDAYEKSGSVPAPLAHSDDTESISIYLKKLSDLIEKSPENVVLKEI